MPLRTMQARPSFSLVHSYDHAGMGDYRCLPACLPWMSVFLLQVGAASNRVGNHMTFQQGNIALKVKDQNRPRIGEREVGEGQVVLRVEAGQLGRVCVHQVNRLKKVSEGLVNVSGERFVVVGLYIVHVIVLFGDGSRIKSGRSGTCTSPESRAVSPGLASRSCICSTYSTVSSLQPRAAPMGTIYVDCRGRSPLGSRAFLWSYIPLEFIAPH